jgi:iron-sulfur cluster assembly protein
MITEKNMISLTDKAAEKVKQQIAQRGRGVGISIGVKTTGCSGLAYVLEYMDRAPATRDWMRYENNGAIVWVNGKDVVYLNGLEIDWVRNGLNEGFDFKNPNERDRCGCGESFRI